MYAPLTCLWLCSVLAFAEAAIPISSAGFVDRGWPRWRLVIALGSGPGPPPGLEAHRLAVTVAVSVAGPLFYRDRKGVLTLVVGSLVAAAAVAIAPHAAMVGLRDGRLTGFFRSNLTRGEPTPIAVQFLGTIYLSPNQSLPWYNTLVWTIAASPVGFMACALLGTVGAVRVREDRFASLAVISWMFLLVLRALPHTPGHDGVRQILPAFGMLALVAGLGVSVRPGSWSRCLIVAADSEGAVSGAVMLPAPPFLLESGSRRSAGAVRLGFEPTYYWDTLTPEVLGSINRQAARASRCDFAVAHFLLLPQADRPTAAGALPFEDSLPWQWYLVQNRPGAMDRVDRAHRPFWSPAQAARQVWGSARVGIWASDMEAVAAEASSSMPNP